jgi:alpha-tubulin suppressor-like RCC1 family protein
MALAATAACAAATACNAIVGVTDVRLRADGGAGDGPEEERDGEPIPDAGPLPRENVLEVAPGELHTCARKPEGTVRCWGDDTQGQTGTGGADGGFRDTPADVAGVDDAIAIASGRSHSCVARRSGAVLCWGFNLDGQLGNGEANNRSHVPVEVSNLSDAIDVAGGGNFSCALRQGGRVSCWGGNGSGQLGNGSKQSRSTPSAVADLDDAVAISAGEAHACAVRRGGSVTCWGDGFNGQLGTGNAPAESDVPLVVPSLADVVAVAAAQRSTCALTRGGSVLCWGANERGQLGSGSANTTPNPSPIVVSGLDDAVSLWAGASHACAVRASGVVVCWGAGSSGQLGDGLLREDASTPTPSRVTVSGINNAIGVRTGGDHSCAATRIGALVCWGANQRGQLGDGTRDSQFSPTAVNNYP